LIAPWILIALTNLSVREIFLVQIVLFVVLFLICRNLLWAGSSFRTRPPREAHRAAMSNS